MSRTLAGNLTGKAARDEAADLRERLQHDAEQREKAKHLTFQQTMEVCAELIEIMTDAEYLEFIDQAPDNNVKFGDACATKLVALKSLAHDAELTESEVDAVHDFIFTAELADEQSQQSAESAAVIEWVSDGVNLPPLALDIDNPVALVRGLNCDTPYVIDDDDTNERRDLWVIGNGG